MTTLIKHTVAKLYCRDKIFFGSDAPDTFASNDMITEPGGGEPGHATENHLDRFLCKVLMENNEGTSDVNNVTIIYLYTMTKSQRKLN